MKNEKKREKNQEKDGKINESWKKEERKEEEEEDEEEEEEEEENVLPRYEISEREKVDILKICWYSSQSVHATDTTVHRMLFLFILFLFLIRSAVLHFSYFYFI